MDRRNHNDRTAWLEGSSAACSIPAGIESSWRLVLLGAPGVGKGTQAMLLSRRLGACHLSTGDVFRAAAGRAACDQTPAMAAALEHMRRGELVPDSTVWEMVRERSGCLRCRGGFILDGFPRTLAQAEALKNHMESEKLPLHAVVNYELPVDEIVSRLGGRRTCGQCQAVFHVSTQPPKTEGRCDRCGGSLFQREDDRPASIVVRMVAYERSTRPLIEFYAALGLLLPVAAAGNPEAICARTLSSLVVRA